MKIFLVPLFLVNGEPSIIDGFYPREQPSLEICEQRKDKLEAYIETLPDAPKFLETVCGTEKEIQTKINSLGATRI